MNLAAYCRTSSTGDGTDSLAAQAQACADWACRSGHEIVATFNDEGLSGRLPVEQRPGLLGALLCVEEGRAAGLVVHRIDRLARELHVQEAALARLWAISGDVAAFEAVEGEIPRDDPLDPHRTFLRQVLGAAAQLERGLIAARLAGGRKRKAATGGYTGGPRLHRRYGFVLTDGEYVPLDAEQLTIQLMRNLRRDCWSYQGIATHLNHLGVPAPVALRWGPTTVRKILLREAPAVAPPG